MGGTIAIDGSDLPAYTNGHRYLYKNGPEAMTVSGMLSVTATGNTLTVALGQYVSCPKAQIAVDPQLGSGTIQPPVTSVQVRHRI